MRRREERERGSFFWESLSYSLVSDAEIDSERRAGLEHVLNTNPCFTIRGVVCLPASGFTSEPLLLDTKGENPRCCRIDMRLNEITHVECLRTGVDPRLTVACFVSNPLGCTCVLSQLGVESARHPQQYSMFVTTSDKQERVKGW